MFYFIYKEINSLIQQACIELIKKIFFCIVTIRCLQHIVTKSISNTFCFYSSKNPENPENERKMYHCFHNNIKNIIIGNNNKCFFSTKSAY